MFVSKIIKAYGMANKKTMEYFNAMAEDYDEKFNFQEPKRCYEETLCEIKKSKGDICVLDVGCGNGTMLRKLCDQYSGTVEAEGIDISSSMVEQAKKLSENYSINYFEGALEDTDLANGKYNIILCMHSFHHYRKPLKILRNMRKALCKDGKLIIVENRKEGWERLQSNYHWIRNDFPDGDLWTYSKYELTFLAKTVGLKRIGYKKCGMHSFMLVCHKN